MPSAEQYRKNPELYRARTRAWYHANGARHKAGRLARGDNRRAKIPHDEVELLVALQGGVCAMPDCEQSVFADGRGTHVDHSHDDLHLIRGVLCAPCNVVLGGYENGKKRESAFREYLNA